MCISVYAMVAFFMSNHIQPHKYKLYLTHRDRVTHTCVGKLSIIGSDNGLSPEQRQAIIGTNAGN